MTAINLIRFIHLLLAVSFLGLQIASYYYLATSRRSASLPLVQYTLGLTLWLDGILILPVLSLYFSCAYLVFHTPGLSFASDWIRAACILLSLVIFCFCANMLIKHKNLKYSKQTLTFKFKYSKIMDLNSIVIIFCLCVIIHDAVTRSTFLRGLT